MFLGRLLMVIVLVAGLGFAALLALSHLVEPEQRETSVPLVLPRPKG